MIKTFRCEETENIFLREPSKKIQGLQKIALRKLNMIHAADNINDLRIPPANHLEKLKGERKDTYSIRINDQWRICFQWKNNAAFNVEIIDYH